MKKALFTAELFLFAGLSVAQITPTLVKDLSPGKVSTYFGPSSVFGNKYVFSMSASTSPNEIQLCVADSKSYGVTFLKSFDDLYNVPRDFVTMNGKLFFAGCTKDKGKELWVTDGTPAGTVIVKDIYPGTASGLIGSPVALYDKVYFFADDGIHGRELWVSDGTTEGTRLFIEFNPVNVSGGSPGNLVVMGDHLFFTAQPGIGNLSLWKTDTSAAQFEVIGDIGGGEVTELIVTPGKLFFTLESIFGGNPPLYNFFCSDGTKNGLQRLAGNVNQLHDYAFMNGKLYFFGNSLNNFIHSFGKLWVTDGTVEGTKMVFDSVREYCSGPGNLIGLVTFKDKLYFGVRSDALGKNSFWVSDGTTSGTHPLASFGKAPNAETAILPKRFTVVDGYLYFRAYDETTKRVNLWRSDGTGQGTHMIEKKGARGNAVSAGFCEILTAPIAVCDSTIFYVNLYDDVLTGVELYRISAVYPENDTIVDSSVVQTTMEFYPNPAEDELNAYFIFGQPTDFDLVVVDVCGRPVKWLEKKKQVSAGWSSATYSVKDLREGVYMLHMVTNETSKVRKIVIHH